MWKGPSGFGDLKPQPPPRLYAVSVLSVGHWETGKATGGIDPQARRPASHRRTQFCGLKPMILSGVTGEE